jgi:methyl-accepting chemotaxis protein
MQIRILCAPVLRLMQRLNYAVLFTAVGIALVIPFVYLLTLQLGGSQDDETFNRKEVGGVRYIAPVHEMMLHAHKRRLALVAQITGQPDASARLSDTATAIDRAVQEVNNAAAEQGKWTLASTGEDRTGAKLNTVRAKWQSARDLDPKTATNEALDAQVAFATEGNDFILNYLANFSNLILDPDLDSYWLMDGYVARLPAYRTPSPRSARSRPPAPPPARSR